MEDASPVLRGGNNAVDACQRLIGGRNAVLRSSSRKNGATNIVLLSFTVDTAAHTDTRT